MAESAHTTRRDVLKATAAGVVTIQTLELLETDPIIDAINAYRAGMDDYNQNAPHDDAEANAYAEVSYAPPMRVLEKWDQPAQTKRGAIEALEFVLNDCSYGFNDPTMEPAVCAALEYLKTT